MKNNLSRRIFSGLAALSLLANSLSAPLSVYSQETQEEITSPEATPIPETTPTPEITPEPEFEVTPTPLEEVTPTPIDEPVVTTAPEETPSETPETLETQETPDTTESLGVSIEPQESSNSQTETTPEVTPVEPEEGTLVAFIMEETLAESISEFDFGYQQVTNASLVTDKPDYAPTGTVIVYGTGFTPNQEYNLEITSETGNFKFSDTVTSDESGGLFYSFQLDGTYRPNYLVEAKNSDGEVVASVTFTDTDTTVLQTVANGTYTAWSGDETDIDETSSFDCGSSDSIIEGTTGDRESFTISLSSIPDGSTITSVDVTVRDRGDSTSGGTYRTFTRLNGTDADNGANLTATGGSGDPCSSTKTQTINVADTVKSGVTTLEIGVVKVAGNTNTVRVGTMTAVVTYTLNLPDLTATKTNNVAGNATVNQAFTWTIHVQNSGAATAIFSNNQDVLWDERPSAGVSSYGTPSVTTSGTTGSFDCTQSGTNNRDIVCEANGAAAMPAGSYIDIAYTVVPSAVGTLNNPRSGESCTADNNNVVAESNEGDNNCSDSVTVSHNIVTNPTLPQVCGLDIALVIDSSGSIEGGELTLLKNAFLAFVAALLPATPTQFSVTEFDTTASVRQSFTSNTTLVNNAINAASSGGFTNWEDGLVKAQSTFDPRPLKPNLVIFASDGNPNRVDNGTSVEESQAVSEAVLVANALKSGGTRVVALGIGNDLDLNNLKAISGPSVGTSVTSDVITSDFDDLAANLATYASELCGGTITVTKLMDGDGNLQTQDDQTPASNWSFNIGQTGSVTGQDGKTDAVTVPAGIHSVTETLQTGFSLLDASCTGALSNGVRNGNSVEGIEIDNGSIVSCTFINTQMGNIIVDKVTDPGQDPESFTFNPSWDDDFSLSDQGTPYDSGPIPAGTYSVSENTPVGWDLTSATCSDQSDPQSISLQAGETVTCTFSNTKKGHLVVNKVTNPSGDLTIFGITATGSGTITGGGAGTISTQSSFDYEVTPGVYAVTETPQAGWDETGNNCQDVEVSAGQTETCSITNLKLGKITVTKYRDRNADGDRDEGEETLSDWDINLDEVTQATDDGGQAIFENLEPGGYSLSESIQEGWFQSNISCEEETRIDNGNDHFVTVNAGDELDCSIGNYQNARFTGVKWYDANANGQDDEEAGLSGWTIFIDENGNGQLDNEEESTQTNQDGNYELGELTPGTYRVCEVGQSGWIQTHPLNSELNNCYEVTVSSGENIQGTDFGNQEIKLGFTLGKSNNKSDGASAGDTLTYTLNLTNTSNQEIHDLKVIDVLPGGFSYIVGSTLIDGTPASDPNIAAGVLTWDIGILAQDASVTISYQAKAPSDAVAGTYTNFATCQGVGYSTLREMLLGAVECDPAASSNVRIGTGTSYGGSVGGIVLGASTELPASGSRTAILLIALVAGAAGVAFRLGGYLLAAETAKKRNKHAKN